ncbi:MAG: SRPBCC family protein [Mariniblastus sp.]
MTKYYFRLLLLFGSVVGFFAIIGSLLPRGYDFETEIEIAAPATRIFPRLNSLKEWKTWSMQFSADEIEGLEVKFNGEESGVGAAQSWSDLRGDGKLWITESNPDKSIAFDMTFGNFPKMNSQIELLPSSELGMTRVVWSSRGRLPGGPFYGYFGSFFGAQMKNQYDLSLEKLKTVMESDGVAEGESEIAIESEIGGDQESKSKQGQAN